MDRWYVIVLENLDVDLPVGPDLENDDRGNSFHVLRVVSAVADQSLRKYSEKTNIEL